jgi:hypothetical protein
MEPESYYGIRTCPPPVPNLSQNDAVRTTTSQFAKIHLDNILPSTSGSDLDNTGKI